jgi:hypothetical protein
MLCSEVGPAIGRKSYFYSVIMLLTVPAYNMMIYKAIHHTRKQEDLFKYYECTGLSFIRLQAWLFFEIGAFFVNIFTLVIKLCL